MGAIYTIVHSRGTVLIIDRRQRLPNQETDDDAVIDNVGGYLLPVMSDECFRGMVGDA
jgi:hypothetical protein